jgi:MFS transporter, BCD family, chlorophyll transporter
MNATPLGWIGILRLGFVQTALGAIVVIITSTINRVMVVELALPAMVPGALVALHYAVQVLRPAWGYGSDAGGRRTPWIIGGMGAIALGAFGAALATVLMSTNLVFGLVLAILSFLLVGMGVGSAGTSTLAMLATRVMPERRAAAATAVWMMMILGFAITAPIAGHFLEPFSNTRLIEVCACVAMIAFIVATAAVWGVEYPVATLNAAGSIPKKVSLRAALAQVWGERTARRLTIFIFASMLAYSAQELVVEPFAGVVFGMTPGATTQLAGVQHSGVLAGMLGVGIAASMIGGPIFGSLRVWTIAGCIASALALVVVAISGFVGPAYPLRAALFALGASNGAFAVAAIGSMMALAAAGVASREGTRMGLWGAAQAVAFGLGGIVGTFGVDVARSLIAAPATAYAIVFFGDAILFLLAAALAGGLPRPATAPGPSRAVGGADDAITAGA